ncbi:RES family NAD+ phosphorylase (plasmid) [Pantoea dispersa]|uniref:RES family NAD+ phosphorylase n=1 Tax=Pantoea dispersa TaxID=59814 RepID=UPI001CA64A01|nr:RES family NAD+ phosphorylase [Pantoea dispersa]QZY93052.1 RES family NAD+ phosphorylase [Pantoea dispersa]
MEEEKNICHSCVGDPYISKEIKKIGSTEDRCNYCHTRKKTLPLTELVEPMHRVFQLFYRVRYDADLYPGYSLGYTAEDIISEELGVDGDISEDIHAALKEEFNDYYDENTYNESYLYRRTDFTSGILEKKWDEVKTSLQSEARFFNNHVKFFFERIFNGLENLQTVQGRNAVTFIDSNATIFRARKFDSYEQVEEALQHPEKHFGPPPHSKATSGRMNAQGIPVFYGATTPDIAIAEVRPAVGSYVVVARFIPVKPLRILEMSALDGLVEVSGSLFDPDMEEKISTASFLRKLSRKLTLPVSGNSDNEYLITQAVAEYLSVAYDLDGISFKSTQQTAEKNKNSNPFNIVLFSKSSSVQNADSNGQHYSVSLFEYDHDEYGSHSWLEPVINKIENNSERISLKRKNSFGFKDYSLQLDAGGLVFYRIKGVMFQTTEYPVRLGHPIVSKK